MNPIKNVRNALLKLWMILLIWVVCTSWVAAGFGNRAMLSFLQAAIRNDEPVFSLYPAPFSLDTQREIKNVLRFSQLAVEFDQNSISLHWQLGRMLAALDQQKEAVQALAPVSHAAARNPLLYLDLLTAHDKLGQTNNLLTFIESVGSFPVKKRALDKIALHYNRKAEWALQAGREVTAQQALSQTLVVRPDDLFAHYHLLQIHKRKDSIENVAEHEQALLEFSLPAIDPLDDRLVDMIVPIFLDLCSNGTWSKETCQNVGANLVWKRPYMAAVEDFLKAMISRQVNHDQQEWSLLLSEWYARNDEPHRALAILSNITCSNADCALNYRTEAILYEQLASLEPQKTKEYQQKALNAWEQYRTFMLNDLLALKRQALLAAKLNTQDTDSLTHELNNKTNVSDVLVEMLELPDNSFEIGPNLLANGGFETIVDDVFSQWVWVSMADGKTWSRSTFVGDADQWGVYEGTSARIDGLMVTHKLGLEGARAGWWQSEITNPNARRSVPVKPQALYVATLLYRTDRMPESKLLWYVSGNHHVLFGPGVSLPSTDGAWRLAVILAKNRSDAVEYIRPLLISSAPGSVWFDEVAIREVKIAEEKLRFDRSFILTIK